MSRRQVLWAALNERRPWKKRPAADAPLGDHGDVAGTTATATCGQSASGSAAGELEAAS